MRFVIIDGLVRDEDGSYYAGILPVVYVSGTLGLDELYDMAVSEFDKVLVEASGEAESFDDVLAAAAEVIYGYEGELDAKDVRSLSGMVVSV